MKWNWYSEQKSDRFTTMGMFYEAERVKMYTQIIGSADEWCKFADEPFDMIICHNVLNMPRIELIS